MEEREQNMVRLGCLRDAVATVDIEQREGYFKKKDNTEDVPTRINLYYQKYLELIQEGRPRPEGFHTQHTPAVQISVTPDKPPIPIQPQMVHPEKKISVLHPDDPMSEKQIDLIYKIIERHDVTDLSEDWRESMTKGEASDFIGKYYKKA